MICKSEVDLTKYGRKLINMKEAADAFFFSVIQKYYAEKRYSNIWTIRRD